MKVSLWILIFFMIVFSAAKGQQIPNGGMENWYSPLHPDSWTDIEDALHVTFNYFTFQDTVDYIEGRASARIITDTVTGNPAAGVQSGFLSIGTSSHSPTDGVNFDGIPFRFIPDSLFFSYKYTSPGADTAFAFIEFRKHHGSAEGMDVLEITNNLLPDSAWHTVGIPLDSDYIVNIIDTIRIIFWASHTQSVGHRAVIGSELHIDGVRFGYNCRAGVTLAADTNSVCAQSATVTLHGLPTGGLYSGTGVSGNQFNPAAAGAGTYELSYSYTDSSTGCSYKAKDTLAVETCTGINPVANEVNLKVFPNPVSTYISVLSAKIPEGTDFQLFDATGRLVIQQKLEETNTTVNISTFSNGLYFYRVKDNTGLITSEGKVVVAR